MVTFPLVYSGCLLVKEVLSGYYYSLLIESSSRWDMLC